MFLFAWFVKRIIKANVNVCKLNEDISIWKSHYLQEWCIWVWFVHAGTYYFKLTFSYESFPLPGLRPRDIRSIDPSLFLTNSMPSLLVLYQLIFVICGKFILCYFFPSFICFITRILLLGFRHDMPFEKNTKNKCRPFWMLQLTLNVS